MAIHKHPESLPESYYKPIGEIIGRFGFTDLYIQVLVWHFLKIKDPKKARMLTFRLDVSRKTDMLQMIGKNWAPSHLKQRIADLAGEANYVRGQRNNLVHGIWGYKPPKSKEYILFYSKELPDTYRLKREVIGLPELQSLVRRVTKLNQDLKKLARDAGAPTP